MGSLEGNDSQIPSVDELLKENRALKRKLALSEQNFARAQQVSDAQNRIEMIIYESVKKEQQFFQLVLENMNNILLLLDFDERFAYASSTFLKTANIANFGLINGSHFKDVLKLHISDENLIRLSRAINDAIVQKNMISLEEQIDFDYRGEPRIFSISVTPMIDENENNTGIMMLFNDITDINRALKEAERANRAKSNFLATMSHEIRTPLNAIIGIAQIQLQNDELPEGFTEAFDKIHISGNILLGIINDILDLSKIETGKLDLVSEEYDISSFINDAVQVNLVRIGSKKINFVIDADENLPAKLYGDELRLKQILNNLLSNAIKYTNQGYVKLLITHTADSGGDVTLRFIVEDTGQGIKPEDQKNLFSEYLRFNSMTNRLTEGTGLGLSITKKLVEMMGGKIDARSEYGIGSTFTVIVKQKAVNCEKIGAETSENLKNFSFEPNKKERRQKMREFMPYGKVLIVDDVKTNLFVAEGLMSPYGLKIETALSGYAAIEKVESGNTYDVIFMDHMMPLMDGIETTQKLRALGYNSAIVALTANALAGNDEMFKQNGFDDFISKPIDIRHLNDILNKYIRDRHPEESEKYKTATEETAQAQPRVISPKLLEVFRRDAEKAVITLRETTRSGDIKLFTTTVHAMKSALANIEESEKSTLAFALEQAGLKGDTGFISANTESFIAMLEALIKSLRGAETVSEGANVQEDVAFLRKQLVMIKTACENYDDTAVYAALDLLKEKTWKTETSATIEKIRDMLFLHSDFDGAADQAMETLNKSIMDYKYVR